MSTIIRIQNPAILSQEIFLDLLERALGASHANLFPEPEKVVEWMRENLADEQIGVFVSIGDNSKLQGIMVASVRTGVFSLLPWILYIFSESREATQDLCLRCQQWFREHGFDRCYAFNTSNKEDQHFEHVAERIGARTPTIIMLGDQKEG
jgi:hypothetical protein